MYQVCQSKEAKLDKTALRPTIFNIKAFEENEAVSSKATDEERFLYTISKTNGWKIITEFKERVFKELEEANRLAMGNGQPFEEIGKNAVVINLAESIVDRILHLVDDAREACEPTDGK
jgi:hypothetical protein